MFEEYTNVAIETARRAGRILLEGFGTSFKISSKEGKNNLVTEYDNRSEEFIINNLKKHFPDFSFLAEESGQSNNNKNNGYVWVIDPLDGTVNYAHNLPIFSVSIALIKRKKMYFAV